MHVAVFVTPPKYNDTPSTQAETERERRELIRLVSLGQALALQACHRVRDLPWLVDQGLLRLNSSEYVALEQIEGPRYNEVFGWAFARAKKLNEGDFVTTGTSESLIVSPGSARL